MGTKDVRDALQLMKLASSIDEVEMTAKTIIKYKPKKNFLLYYLISIITVNFLKSYRQSFIIITYSKALMHPSLDA